VVSVPTEEHNIHIWHTSPLIPLCGAQAFNAAWAALHTLQEHIDVLRKWPQDIPRSLLALGMRS
jgi:hypothetical protein